MGIRDVAYSRPHGQQRKTRFNLALFYWAIHLGCLARFSVPLRLEPQYSDDAHLRPAPLTAGGLPNLQGHVLN